MTARNYSVPLKALGLDSHIGCDTLDFNNIFVLRGHRVDRIIIMRGRERLMRLRQKTHRCQTALHAPEQTPGDPSHVLSASPKWKLAEFSWRPKSHSSVGV